MKPFFFFLLITPLILGLFIAYGVHERNFVLVYDGEATMERVCESLPAPFFGCSAALQQRLNGAFRETASTQLSLVHTKKGSMMATLRSGQDTPPSPWWEYALKGVRFMFSVLRADYLVSSPVDTQDIAWYISSRNVALSFANFLQQYPAVLLLVQDFNQEYRVVLQDIVLDLREVHMMRFTKEGDYALVLEDVSLERLTRATGKVENLITHVLAAQFPQEVSRRLPDGSLAVEYMFNPSRFTFVSQHINTLPVRVLPVGDAGASRDDVHHTAVFVATQGKRVVFATSLARLQELMKGVLVRGVGNTIARWCNNHFLVVPQEQVIIALPQGFWYGATDALEPKTLYGCLVHAPYPSRSFF